MNTNRLERLPRNIKIDWLRFQVVSQRNCFRTIHRTLKLPFQKKAEQMNDVRDTNTLALNRIWHEVHEFQGSLIGTRYPDPGTGLNSMYRHFVDLNGSTLSGIDLNDIIALLFFCQVEYKFIANRIDIALDFPPGSPRLSERNWESFLDDNLLVGYRSLKRISQGGTVDRSGTTVYLGSRQSERFVRIYDKKIGDEDYDRFEVEFKGSKALSIVKKLTTVERSYVPQFLNDVACGAVSFSRYHSDIEFFNKYRSASAINIPSAQLHLDIERSIAFLEKHAATLAMVEEYMGSERFDKFMRSLLSAGKLNMKPRHRRLIENARALALGIFSCMLLFFIPANHAIASGLSCPAPAPLSFQFTQKFPIDIVQPTPSEQAYLNAIGDGCFHINSGLNFDKICLPGMIVDALKPFIVIGLGIKFIFGD